MDNSITITTNTQVSDNTLVSDNTFYVYGNSSINSSTVTYSEIVNSTFNWFNKPEIRFGFIIKFKRSVTKIKKSWTDDLLPEEELKLKRIL